MIVFLNATFTPGKNLEAKIPGARADVCCHLPVSSGGATHAPGFPEMKMRAFTSWRLRGKHSFFLVFFFETFFLIGKKIPVERNFYSQSRNHIVTCAEECLTAALAYDLWILCVRRDAALLPSCLQPQEV